MKTNIIYNEDCLTGMKKLPSNSIDIVVTSPPYNIGKNRVNCNFNKVSYEEYNDKKDIQEYFKFIKDRLDEMLRVTKYHIFFNIQEVTNNKGIYRFIENEYKDYIKERFIWAKTNPPSSIQDTCCSSGWEYIYCISKDNPSKRTFNYCNFSNRKGDYIKNIIIKPVNSDKDTEGFNFSFPRWMPRFFISNFSKKGDIVLDPFSGIGTTAVASEELNRQFIGYEITKNYINKSYERLSKNKSKYRKRIKDEEIKKNVNKDIFNL